MNNYELLDINKDSGSVDIKRAYFKKVKEYSPEKDSEMFMQIREAYDTLMDEDLKREYDKKLELPEDERIIRAMELEKNGDLKQAIELVKSALESYPESRAIKETLGSLYEKNGGYGNAIKVYQSLTEEYPLNQEYAFALARSLLNRGYIKKANAQFEKTIAMDIGNADIWHDWIAENICEDYLRKIEILKMAEAVSEDIFKNHYNIYARLWRAQARGENTSYDLLYKYLNYYENDNKYGGKYDKEDMLLHCLRIMVDNYKLWGNEDRRVFEKGLDLAKQSITSENQHKLDYLELKICFDGGAGNRLDNALHDLTIMAMELNESYDADTEREMVAVKLYILSNFSKLKGQIIRIQRDYPQFYELNWDFYERLLDAQKRKGLEKSIKKQINTSFADMDIPLSFGEDDFISEEPFRREQPKVGRNDPCPCGSGKKYKRCCGA